MQQKVYKPSRNHTHSNVNVLGFVVMVISKFLKLVRAFVSRIYITIQEMSNNNTIQLNELHSTPPLMGLMKVKRRSVILNETLLRP